MDQNSNNQNQSTIKKCPMCGREYPKKQAICPKCDVVLMRKKVYEQLEMDKNLNAIQNEVKKLENQQNVPKCPTCGSTNIKRITTLDRAVSVGTLGLLSGKIGKNYECLDCKAKW